MLFDDLKKANIEAMKAKDSVARSALTLVISRCQYIIVESRANGKEFNDGVVLETIQKIMKELSDEKADFAKVNNSVKVEEISKQEEYLKKFLPKQLTKEEILEEINKLADKSMPTIMKHFKTNFAGQVDMSLVSQIARSL